MKILSNTTNLNIYRLIIFKIKEVSRTSVETRYSCSYNNINDHVFTVFRKRKEKEKEEALKRKGWICAAFCFPVVKMEPCNRWESSASLDAYVRDAPLCVRLLHELYLYRSSLSRVVRCRYRTDGYICDGTRL